MGNVISDLASGATGGIFGGLGDMAVKLRQAFKGVEIDPTKAAEINEKLAEIEAASITAQTKINEIEAASPSVFVSGWRPAAGWVCVAAMGYAYVVAPFAVLVLRAFHVDIVLPVLSMSELMPLLLGMLGLVGARSYEKKQGVEREN